MIKDRLINIFVQHSNNNLSVIKKFSLVTECHVVRVGSQLVGKLVVSGKYCCSAWPLRHDQWQYG